MNKKRKPYNKYPLPDRIVKYSRKKHIQPIPEVGKKYHCFDDGKITFSRHYIVEISEVLGYMEFKRKYPEWFITYTRTSKSHYWLYSRSSDKFIIVKKGENNMPGCFVRTKQGGWFGIGDWFNSGELDVTGELWNNLVANIDNFNYSEEEKQQLISENKLD